MKRLFSRISISLAFLLVVGTTAFGAPEAEPELVIVKYGKIYVKSSIPNARIFVDDVYKGQSDRIIENIIVGDRKITCISDQMVTSGKFSIRRDDILKLEARFDTGELVLYAEPEKIEKVEPKVEPPKVVVEPPKVELPKVEVAKVEKPKVEKPKVEKPKQEKPKKAAETKKSEKKDAGEDRHALHLNILKLSFDDLDAQEVHVRHKTSAQVISKFIEKKNQSGKYYRTKSNMLLCDKGPCEQQWSSSFTYTDEAGKPTTFTLTWLQTVFNGITPAGTSKRELIYCVDGSCSTLLDASIADEPKVMDSGRYSIRWSKSSLTIRRTDIAKEITDAGGSLEAY